MTSGNGPASGAGNLWRETFTSILETAVQPMFRAARLKFQTQNYAIQAMSSGDEVALCATELYGRSYDVLFWDFDMTDEQDYWKLALFVYRTIGASTTTTTATTTTTTHDTIYRPALIAFQQSRGHASVLSGLEEIGMTVLGRDSVVQRRQDKACPNSSHRTKEERDALPPHLQYIRCGNLMEEGGPKTYDDIVDGKKMCRGHKFNLDVCANRPRKYIWHPGWRVNAIKGYTLAMTLTELLIDAMEELIVVFDSSGDDSSRQQQWQDHLATLQKAEQADYERILATPGIVGPGTWLSAEKMHTIHEHIDLDSLFKRPALCRTALLPSKSRLLQAADAGKGATTLVTNLYNETYEMGVMLNKFRSFETASNNNDNGGYRYADKERENEMVIVTDKLDYLVDEACTEQLAINHQDVFIVSSAQGWRSMTLPSKAELRYSPDFHMATAKGWIFLCLFICNDSKCPPHDLHDRIYQKPFTKEEDAASMLQEFGHLEMTVNGVEVTSFERLIKTKYSHLDNCLTLAHNTTDASSNGNPYQWKPTRNGKYILNARIVNASQWSYVKISSIIIM